MEKSVFFPIPKHLEKFQKALVLEMQNVMQIATNAGHTGQNDGLTAQKDQRGLEEPPGPQGTLPTPILEKTLVSRNDF